MNQREGALALAHTDLTLSQPAAWLMSCDIIVCEQAT